jgi:hypothetical protein
LTPVETVLLFVIVGVAAFLGSMAPTLLLMWREVRDHGIRNDR